MGGSTIQSIDTLHPRSSHNFEKPRQCSVGMGMSLLSEESGSGLPSRTACKLARPSISSNRLATNRITSLASAKGLPITSHSGFRERVRKRRGQCYARLTHSGQFDVLTMDISTASRPRLWIQIWPPPLFWERILRASPTRHITTSASPSIQQK